MKLEDTVSHKEIKLNNPGLFQFVLMIIYQFYFLQHLLILKQGIFR